jgi:hypothetical protein
VELVVNVSNRSEGYCGVSGLMSVMRTGVSGVMSVMRFEAYCGVSGVMSVMRFSGYCGVNSVVSAVGKTRCPPDLSSAETSILLCR